MRPVPVNFAVAGLFFAMAVTAKKERFPERLRS
jgi:hypothetical protein